MELPYDLILLLGRCSREMKICPPKNLYMNVHRSIIHSIQEWKQTKHPVNRRQDKENVLYPYNGLLTQQ